MTHIKFTELIRARQMSVGKRALISVENKKNESVRGEGVTNYTLLLGVA